MLKKFALLALAATALLTAKPEAVVFDFGGVMCSTPRKKAVTTFLCDSLNMTKEEYTAADNMRRFEIHNGITDTEFWHDQARQRGIKLDPNWDARFLKILKNAIRINEEMYDTVFELKENNIHVAILSNITPNKVHLLKEFGYYAPFETLILSCEVGLVKPDPRIYQLMLDRLQAAPEKILFVDDKQANVDAAESLGIKSHLFTTTSAFRAFLQENNAL